MFIMVIYLTFFTHKKTQYQLILAICLSLLLFCCFSFAFVFASRCYLEGISNQLGTLILLAVIDIVHVIYLINFNSRDESFDKNPSLFFTGSVISYRYGGIGEL